MFLKYIETQSRKKNLANKSSRTSVSSWLITENIIQIRPTNSAKGRLAERGLEGVKPA